MASKIIKITIEESLLKQIDEVVKKNKVTRNVYFSQLALHDQERMKK